MFKEIMPLLNVNPTSAFAVNHSPTITSENSSDESLNEQLPSVTGLRGRLRILEK